MARGVKPKKDRKSVRSIRVAMRLSEYEFDDLMTHLDVEAYPGTISEYIRQLVLRDIRSKD